MTDVTEEQWIRDAFNDIAEAAVVDPDADRPLAWSALRHQTRRRAQRRIGTGLVAVAAVVALVTVIAWPDGGGHGPLVKTVRPVSDRPLKVVATIADSGVPDPMAYDGRDVWLARQAYEERPKVVVERHDAASGALLTSIDVSQEAVFGIAADGAGSVWIAGGGDGGVPQTTVTRIDTATRRVALTHTLDPQSCSCRIVAGAGGVWLGGNGDERILRLDPDTGKVVATVALPTLSFSLAVAGDRVLVGLDDSRVAVIDPATNSIERLITIATSSLPAFGVIVHLDPVPGRPGASWATRSDGYAFAIAANARVSGSVRVFLRPVGITSAALMGDRLWAVGVDQLFFDGGGIDRGYANYVSDGSSFVNDGASFDPIVRRTARFVPNATQEDGLDVIVAAGSTLWIVDRGGTKILVVQP